MATKKKLETPGVVTDEQNTAQDNLTNIENKAKDINEAIELNKAIIADDKALPDEKEQAQIKLDALLETQAMINSAVEDSRTALDAIKAQAQLKAATVRNTDLTAVNINKQTANTIEADNVRLTDRGYVVDAPKGAKL